MLASKFVSLGLAAALLVIPSASAQCDWELVIDRDQLLGFDTRDLLAASIAGRDLFMSSGVQLNLGEPPFPAVRGWDGENLTDLDFPPPFPFPSATQLEYFGGQVIATGYFGSENEGPPRTAAAWDGKTWSYMSGFLSGHINDFAVVNDTLYAAGAFTFEDAPGQPHIVARWDGVRWGPMHPKAALSGGAQALTDFNGQLVAGGSFEQVDTSGQSNVVMRWTGEAWEPFDQGLWTEGSPLVFHLVRFGNELFASGAGMFPATAASIARRDSGDWVRADFRSDGITPWNLPATAQFGIHKGELVTAGYVVPTPQGRRWSLLFWTGVGWQRRGPSFPDYALLQDITPDEIWLGHREVHTFACVQTPGDLQCDGHVTLSDIAPFVAALTDRITYYDQFPTCNINSADVNQNGAISVADIGAFVELLVGN